MVECNLCSLVWLIGAATLTRMALRLLKGTLRTFQSGVDVRKFGKWAVVTGCTNGIGKAYAEQLAAKGLNIILLSRNPETLKQEAEEIESKYKVQTKVIVCDLAKATDDDYTRIAREITNTSDDVGILVNNAGLSFEFPEFTHDVPIERQRDIVAVNNRAMVELTNALLPTMIKRKSGLIINIGSLSGIVPTPLLSVYSASKAFVDFYSACLAKEYKSKGIVVQCCTPGFVVSNLSKIRKTSFGVPSATAFVKKALSSIGALPVRAIPWVPHRLQALAMRTAPKPLVQSQVMKMHLSIRKRALAKKAGAARTGK